MPRRPRVIVGMSGGVDSSVAAWLLKQQGYEVVGLFMKNWEDDDTEEYCTSRVDLVDAAAVADVIGIELEAVNFAAEYRERVFAHFLREYAAGRTPNPDVLCNSEIKFRAFLDHARALGADRIATGHYARVRRDSATGRWSLLRGSDPAKDQSYFLFPLTQAQLARAWFPLGDLQKPQVRELARTYGLEVADKPDSQEICFVPGNDYAAVVERLAPGAVRPGPVVDTAGRVLGRHAGIHHYTIGQRKGLGISAPEPLFVVGIDATAGTVVVGTRPELLRNALRATRVNWIAGAPPERPVRAEVQIRYHHAAAAATVEPIGRDGATVVFDAPQSAVTPGQAVVFYGGDEVVGGGWIGG